MRSLVSLLCLFILYISLSACDEQANANFENHDSSPSLVDLSFSQETDQTMLANQDQGLTQDDDQELSQDEDLNRNHPLPPAGYPLFALPIFTDDLDVIDHRVVFGVDHDPSEGQRIRCEDYMGRIFPYCYDGHQGSDFILLGGFETMDQNSARVQSALAGVVVDLEDGNYDRCHADVLTAEVSCDGYPMRANYVTIEHDNGWRTDYYHLKRGSIVVTLGERVTCGSLLGLIGSSGYSSAPHLHFEVSDRYNMIWDPFAGPYSQMFSLWKDQPSSGNSESLPSTSCSSP